MRCKNTHKIRVAQYYILFKFVFNMSIIYILYQTWPKSLLTGANVQNHVEAKLTLNWHLLFYHPLPYVASFFAHIGTDTDDFSAIGGKGKCIVLGLDLMQGFFGTAFEL